MGNCVSLSIPCDQTMNRACGCLFGDGNYIHTMEENLEALEKAMQELKEKRADLTTRVSVEENKGLQRLDQVQGWFKRVESVESQVNVLFDARSTETNRLCLFGYCSKKCMSSYDYGKKVMNKLKDVNELLSKGVFEVVAQKIPAPKVVQKHIQPTVGLDTMVERTWNLLMNNDKPRICGLYGMGGVGKTTLLARINNKFLEEMNGFDIVIWVVVSSDLQNDRIQNQILEKLDTGKEWNKKTTTAKADCIKSILNRKKFVLLLDDLWSKVDLGEIGIPPVTQENGSKIVFTTRSKEVCRDMEADDEKEVVCLSSDEAWELFQLTVGEIPLKSHQNIPALAEEFAKKCCGLPLALSVIGKAMSCKDTVQEWYNAINVLNSSSHKLPSMEENILPILKFSYDNLKDENVKSCLLYCSLFPEDFEIDKDELVEYWNSEGFIDGPISQGYDIIGSLVRAQLLMDGVIRNRVKMHDVIREMALWIATNSGNHKETLCVKSGAQLDQIPEDINWELVKRVSLFSNQIAKIALSPKCPNLSTLLLQNNKLESIPGEFFLCMPALVVLDLSENDSILELPGEISRLSSLQYLNLSFTGIKRLPVGLKELSKLIELNVEYTFELQSIIEIVTGLQNLQVLRFFFSRVCVDRNLMKVLQSMKSLQVLTVNINDASVLEMIQGDDRLARCTRALCLSNITTEDVTFNTVALGGLQRLGIVNAKISEIKIDWESEEKRGILSTTSPGFNNLITVHIINLEGPKDLTWLLFAQNIWDLVVTRSSSIEEIINGEKGLSISKAHPHIDVNFTKLELLEVSYLAKLCSHPPAPPNMRKFIVYGCPKLLETVFDGLGIGEQDS